MIFHSSFVNHWEEAETSNLCPITWRQHYKPGTSYTRHQNLCIDLNSTSVESSCRTKETQKTIKTKKLNENGSKEKM
jgi:hypothetical protein